MNFVGAAVKLSDDDISSVAADLGVEEAALRAVLAVETGGSGFDHGNRPKALFERHYFYKFLSALPEKQSQAVDQGLAYPKWGEKPYPKGSDAVYAEITAACAIDEDAALRSVSWGLGQIMGNNFLAAGCDSVREMVEAACNSEKDQLTQMASFIRSNGLLQKLKDKDWVGFAKGYNGPGYAQNHYDVKLANNYGRFAIVA